MPTRHPAITIGASSKNNDQKALSVPRPMSPVMADSKMYGRPLNSRASRGADGISTPCKRTRSFDQVADTESAFTCTGQLTFPPNVYLMGKPPVCTTVPAAVGVKNAGMPAPPARSRSASVPCGVSSTSSSPPRYCRANSLFSPGIRHVAVDNSRRARDMQWCTNPVYTTLHCVPTYDDTMRLICFVLSSMPRPQSSTPQLLLSQCTSRHVIPHSQLLLKFRAQQCIQ